MGSGKERAFGPGLEDKKSGNFRPGITFFLNKVEAIPRGSSDSFVAIDSMSRGVWHY